jgi:ankyrin repeat protein
VVRGDLNIIRFLVEENARLDAIDAKKRTPLIKAVLGGLNNPEKNLQICDLLLKGGATDGESS